MNLRDFKNRFLSKVHLYARIFVYGIIAPKCYRIPNSNVEGIDYIGFI